MQLCLEEWTVLKFAVCHKSLLRGDCGQNSSQQFLHVIVHNHHLVNTSISWSKTISPVIHEIWFTLYVEFRAASSSLVANLTLNSCTSDWRHCLTSWSIWKAAHECCTKWCMKVYSFELCNCSSVGSPAVVFVKGKLCVQGFEGCRTSGSPAVQCGA